jgi:hypothetical protein
MFQILLNLFNRVENILSNFWKRFEFSRLIEEIINGFPILIKLINKRKYTIFIVNFLLLIIQSKPIIENFIDSKIITRIEIHDKIYLPFVRLNFEADSVIKQSIKYQMKNKTKFHELFKLKENSNIEKVQQIYSNFLLDLLIKKKFEQFSSFVNPKLVIDSCKILITSKEYNCGNIISSLEFNENIVSGYNIFLFSNWNTTQNDSLIKTERFANFDKVVIRIRRIDKQIILLMNSNYDFESNNNWSYDNLFSIENKKYLNIHFETNSMQKMNTNQNKCNESRNDRMLFTDDYSNDCKEDCLLNTFNKFYGCLPFKSNFSVGFEKDFKTFKYKLCSIEEMNSREINTTFENEFKAMKKRAESVCKTQCIEYCNQINLISGSEHSLSTNKSEDILINIIPVYRLNIRYIETFQTDINDLIYELGGTLGLWFGLSGVSLFDILWSQMILIRKIAKLFINFLMKSLIFLKKK